MDMPRINDTITAISGIRVGHVTDKKRLTGCTVMILETRGFPVVAAEVRGGLPGTYGTSGLAATATIRSAKALFLAGGSLDGMETAAGMRRYLMEHSKLRPIFGVEVKPPVGISGAILFDLGRRKGNSPTAEMGYEACERASDKMVEEGNVGAGTGCTIGKLLGLKYSMKGGLGSSCTTLPNGLMVGAIVAVNAVGNVVDYKTGKTIAGTRREDEKGFWEFTDLLPEIVQKQHQMPTGTTIGIVATNADLQHDDVLKVVEMAHDGLARAIRPSHTATDGDTLFAVATRELRGFIPTKLERQWLGVKRDIVGHLAAEQVSKAILRAVRSAKTIKFPGAWMAEIPGLARQIKNKRDR